MKKQLQSCQIASIHHVYMCQCEESKWRLGQHSSVPICLSLFVCPYPSGTLSKIQDIDGNQVMCNNMQGLTRSFD
jgi:hypothetical protein